MQGVTVDPFAQWLLHRQNRGQRCFRRLTVTGIGNAFAPAGVTATADLRDNDDGFRLGAAADGKSAGDWPAFDPGD